MICLSLRSYLFKGDILFESIVKASQTHSGKSPKSYLSKLFAKNTMFVFYYTEEIIFFNFFLNGKSLLHDILLSH